MARKVQVYNPVHLQKVKTSKLNVMGRVHGGKRKQLSIYLNNFLIRKVTPSANGAFECRVDLSRLSVNEKHQVEIRMVSGLGTERIMVPFFKVTADKEPVIDEPSREDNAKQEVEEEDL
jgi:hypothetical protein